MHALGVAIGPCCHDMFGCGVGVTLGRRWPSMGSTATSPLSQGGQGGAVMLPSPLHRANPALVHQGNNRPPTYPSAPPSGAPKPPLWRAHASHQSWACAAAPRVARARWGRELFLGLACGCLRPASCPARGRAPAPATSSIVLCCGLARSALESGAPDYGTKIGAKTKVIGQMAKASSPEFLKFLQWLRKAA